ncbi:hypothetical protein ACHWQZ_G005824 [Mnemiopsis leidyi]
MSTQLQDLGYICDVEEIKAFLFNDEAVTSSWLDIIQYSLSTSGDLISFLYKNRLVISKLKHDPVGNTIEYEIAHKGVIADINAELASSILCLSVALQQKSVGATTLLKTSTWNCIAIGFSSGYFRIYTENGVQLFEQIFHPQPIKSLKYCLPKVLQDELLVIYDDILIAVDGFSLFQCLRFCRLQQQRSTTTTNAAKNVSISFKKWSLQDQKSTIDVEFYGVRNTTPFEHLYQASLAGGSANYIGQAGLGPVYNYVAVGKGPFIAQYCPSEQASQPIMSEVVMSVATKLMSYIPGSSWLTGWSQGTKENQITFEPPIAISKNICIDDPRREIVSIKASPRGSLAVLADTFGRLLLLDVSSMILVNIWKGYRDAQCGWIVVPCNQTNELVTSKPQSTLFLVIYAKKRGILEIWCPYQHYRVAAFNVGKKGVLLSSMYGALGEGSLSAPLTIPDWRPAKSNCFIVQETGKVINISVPFESCLGLEYLLSLEDAKLVEKACDLLQSDSFNSKEEEETEKIIEEIKLALNIGKVVQAVFDSPHIALSYKTKICNNVMADISHSKDLHQQPEFVKVYHSCNLFLRLSALYSNVSEHWKAAKFLSSSNQSHVLLEILPVVEKYFDKAKINSSYDFPGIIEFNKSFFITTNLNSINEKSEIQIDLPEHQKETVSRFLTLLFLHSEDWIPILDQLLNCGMSLQSIFTMFIEACLTLDIQISSEAYQSQISTVVQHILLRFVEPKELWDIMFDVLKSNTNVCQGLILAIYCQAIAVDTLEFTTTTFETEQDSLNTSSETGSADDQEWVALNPEHEQWYTTRQQLSDVLHLQINTGVDCTVNTLLHSNDLTVTHVVANYIIENDLIQNVIDWVERCRNHKADDSEATDDDEVFDDNLNWLLNVVPWWPYQLHPTTISVCLVECLIFRWSAVLEQQSPDVDIKHLISVSKILLSLKSVSVQQILLNVLWETVFCTKIKKIYALIEKVGRQPKDRLCVKELSLTLNAAIAFISIARHILVNVNISSDPNEENFVVKQENVWASENRSWLIHKVVSTEHRINPDFVILHAQIVTALELIMSLNIKNIRPSVLFHSKFTSLFFTPLTTSGTFKFSTSPDIDTLHEQMLKMCVKSSISSDLTIKPHETSWTNLIVNIATLWEIAIPIQSYLAVFLYSLGKFDEGGEIVMTSSHRQELGVELLSVLLSLLETLIFLDEESQKKYLPVLSPSLSSWLRSKRDPNVALLDMKTVFKAFSNVLTWVSGNDVIVINSRELRVSLLKVL